MAKAAEAEFGEMNLAPRPDSRPVRLDEGLKLLMSLPPSLRVTCLFWEFFPLSQKQGEVTALSAKGLTALAAEPKPASALPSFAQDTRTGSKGNTGDRTKGSKLLLL